MPASHLTFAAFQAESAMKAVRGEAACVRALLDEVERLTPSSVDQHALSAQLIEELGRLSRRIHEAARSLATVVNAAEAEPPKSGVELVRERSDATS